MKKKRTISLVNVQLPKGIDLVHAVTIAQGDCIAIGTDETGLAADVGQIGALVERRDMLEMNLELEAIWSEDLVTADAFALVALCIVNIRIMKSKKSVQQKDCPL